MSDAPIIQIFNAHGRWWVMCPAMPRWEVSAATLVGLLEGLEAAMNAVVKEAIEAYQRSTVSTGRQ